MRKFVACAALLLSCALAIPANAQSTGGSASIIGTVTSDGRPVAAARVTISGTSNAEATTDALGHYSFPSLAPGTYAVAVSKGGYDTARENNVYLLAGTSLQVDVTLTAASFSSLRTIASVRVGRGGAFNTSPAAIDVVNAQQFSAQGAQQVTQILNQIPGIQISYPGSSANGAATGAITFPNIRNGLSYETASLIDGHPLSVGLYGDYVTTFLNPSLLQDAEVIKGPGATAPEVDYAINGTVNFRTKDPTPNAEPFFSAGATNTGGSIYSLGVSDTIFNGRLGFVVGIAGYNEISWLNNAPVYFDPGTGSGDINGQNTYPYGCNGLNGSSTPTALLGTNPNTFYSRVYNGCTAVATTTVSSEFDSLSELFKLKYKVGNNTWLTGSYFGSQARSNQSGNTSNVIPSIFNPSVLSPTTSPYKGSLQAGTLVDVLSAAYDAQPQFETNNEPIWQLELNTSFSNNDTLLARFYHATIARIQSAGNPDPFQPYPQFTNIYGILKAFTGPGSAYIPFNGGTTLVQQYNYFNDPEIDQLTGYTLEYTHPFGPTNELTLSGDFTRGTSVDYYNDLSFGNDQCMVGTAPGGYCYNVSTSLPAGAGQSFLTALLRDREQFTPKFAGTFSLYQNVYHSSFPINCLTGPFSVTTPSGSNTYENVCQPDGTLDTYSQVNGSSTLTRSVPVTFNSTTVHHMDPRAGLEWRPHNNVAIRFSMGSSIAPPYLYVISQPNQITPPTTFGHGAFATQTINAGNLRAETAWGYDLGGDYAFHDNVDFARVDLYETNLYGQFNNEQYVNGVCGAAICGPKYANTPVIASQYQNLSNSRYEGIEVTLQRIPQGQGWGFMLAGSTQRGYAYNLPPNFYCGFVPTRAHPCIPVNYNTNLNILSGVNYQGEYIDNTGGTTSGVDNQSVPYLQGSAQVNYHFHNGAFAMLGETLYGKNNSFNRPPFGVAFASVNYPINSTVAIQVSGSNIFNAYKDVFPVYGGGVTVPLTNGLQAGTIGNVLGPARYTFMLTKVFGPANTNIIQATGKATSH